MMNQDMDGSGDPFEEAARRFVFLYRTNGLSKNEMVRRRRECIQWFSSLRFKRVYDLKPHQIEEILSKTDASYFADYNDSYEDPASMIIRDNLHGRLSSFLILLVRNRILSRSEYDEPFKHMNCGIKTELAAMIDPSMYVAKDVFSEDAMKYLGFTGFGDSYLGYINFLAECRKMAESLQKAGILRADLSTVSEFLLVVFSECCGGYEVE